MSRLLHYVLIGMRRLSRPWVKLPTSKRIQQQAERDGWKRKERLRLRKLQQAQRD